MIAVVEPEGWADNPDDRLQPQLRWVQVTQLGLSQSTDAELRQVWATDLNDGRPLSGVAVQLVPTTWSGTTDGEGLASRAHSADEAERDSDGQPSYLVARQGEDSAILPVGFDYRYDVATNRTRLLWYTFDDRGIYRPGEQVHVKGWLRPYDWGKGGDLRDADPAITAIDYVLNAPNGEKIAEGTMDVSPAGGFDEAFTLPADVELGDAWLNLTARGGELQRQSNPATASRSPSSAARSTRSPPPPSSPTPSWATPPTSRPARSTTPAAPWPARR